MSRLQAITRSAAESSRKLLIPYLIAGDPDLDATLVLMHELAKQGADVIELGIPFSDPASDGPVIQQGVERALASKTSLRATLELVGRFREQDKNTGIVLMGYLNPIEIMGYSEFVSKAADVGVDGVLVVDMPPAESGDLHQQLRSADLDTIYLVAPTTTDERARAIVQRCSGYLYYVSLKGVTGAALTDYQSVTDNISELRRMTELPIVIGFGIKDAASASAMAEQADGIIIGSALVSEIGKLNPGEALSAATLSQTCGIIGAAREAINNL